MNKLRLETPLKNLPGNLSVINQINIELLAEPTAKMFLSKTTMFKNKTKEKSKM